MSKTARILRVYADSSVYGGCFDEEFANASRQFFDQIVHGDFALVTSAVVEAELSAAPIVVQQHFHSLLHLVELVQVSEATLSLQRAYLSADILGPRWKTDALHVALATAHRCDVIVSWNFKHIVHFQKMIKYNAVNLNEGFATIAIHSPAEIISYEEEI